MTVLTHTLSNGFRIVTERMDGLASASIGIWVNAGARHEQANQNGTNFYFHWATTLLPSARDDTINSLPYTSRASKGSRACEAAERL